MSIEEHPALIPLFDSLVSHLVDRKAIKRSDGTESILYALLNMTRNNYSSTITESSGMIPIAQKDALLSQRYIKEVYVNNVPRYALTFKGVAYCIKTKFNIGYEEQLFSLASAYDEKYGYTSEEEAFDWKEKLATLTLMLLSCSSEQSAIIVDEAMNQSTFENALREVLEILQKYGLLSAKYTLPESRGEPQAALFMRSRINNLPKKSRHIYTNMGRGRGYYLDVEEEDGASDEKLGFLLRKIFENYDPEINYAELKDSLLKTGEKYHPSFLTRVVNTKMLFGITNKLDHFFNQEIFDLPPKS